MAASSNVSVQNVKPLTLSVSDRLEILQAAIADLQKHGLVVRVTPLYGTGSVAIVLDGVAFEDGNLKIAGKEML